MSQDSADFNDLLQYNKSIKYEAGLILIHFFAAFPIIASNFVDHLKLSLSEGNGHKVSAVKLMRQYMMLKRYLNSEFEVVAVEVDPRIEQARQLLTLAGVEFSITEKHYGMGLREAMDCTNCVLAGLAQVQMNTEALMSFAREMDQ